MRNIKRIYNILHELYLISFMEIGNTFDAPNKDELAKMKVG